MREEFGIRSIIHSSFSRKPSLVARDYAAHVAMQANENVKLDVSPGTISTEYKGRLAGVFGGDFDDDKPFAFYNGIAVIPIYGTLVNRLNFCGWGFTGYDFIRSQYDAALSDPDVKGIAFDINSYGGMVYGNFELAQYIKSRNQEKPMMGMVNAMMFSGGYSLGSALPRLIATPSADVGSIGVMMMHIDLSEAMSKMGVKVTLLHAGDHKVDGNPYNPLSEEVQKNFQARIDDSYKQFVALVASNRNMEESAVRDTQADIFPAEEAKSLGLIDDISAPEEAFISFSSELSGSRILNSKRSITMSDTQKNNEAGNQEAPDTKKAASDERARCKAITGCEEAKGREQLANHLAYNTDMSAEEAVGILKASPAQSKTGNDEGDAPLKGKKGANAGNAFEQAMSKGNPNISSQEGNGDAEEGKKVTSSERVAAIAKAAGYKSE